MELEYSELNEHERVPEHEVNFLKLQSSKSVFRLTSNLCSSLAYYCQMQSFQRFVMWKTCTLTLLQCFTETYIYSNCERIKVSPLHVKGQIQSVVAEKQIAQSGTNNELIGGDNLWKKTIYCTEQRPWTVRQRNSSSQCFRGRKEVSFIDLVENWSKQVE